MRLQMLIRRHGLPPTAVLWTPGGFTANSTIKDYLRLTVSELLEQVNEVVPLEWEEWGLEDYVVEVNGYECFHFQELGAILREDDEVQIRALQTPDLRIRKLSGRHQIARDGKHLIDGVAFGRRFYKRSTERPAVAIPPRKRIRFAPVDEDNNAEESVGGIEERSMQRLIEHTLMEEEFDSDEEDDDDDFEGSSPSSESDNEDDQISSTEDLSEDLDMGRKTKKRKLRLQDAPQDGLEAQSPGMFSPPSQNYLENCLILDDGTILPILSNLLQSSASDLSTQQHSPHPSRLSSHPSRVKTRPGTESASITSPVIETTVLATTTKRKRGQEGVQFDLAQSNPSTTLEISQPGLSPELPNSNSNSKRRVKTRTSNVTTSKVHADKKSGHKTPASLSSSRSSSVGASSSSETSATESSSESTSSADSTSDSDSDSHLDSDSDSTSSSGSSSKPSDTSSDASSDSDSGSEVKQIATKKSQKASRSSESIPAKVATTSLSKDPVQKNTAPGAGSTETKKRNLRRRRRNRLQSLKDRGLIPVDATLEDLSHYDAHRSISSGSEFDPSQASQHDSFEMKRQSLLQSLAGGGVELVNDDTSMMTSTQKFASSTQGSGQGSPSATPRDEGRRSKLDVASTRRMLFGSLGLRTPKTKEDEKKISEKLMSFAKPLRNAKTQQSTTHQADQQESTPVAAIEKNGTSTVDNSTSWFNKINLTAEECIDIDVKLGDPPFPFQQRWDPQQNQHELDRQGSGSGGKKKKKKSKARQSEEAALYETNSHSTKENGDDAYHVDPEHIQPISSDEVNGAIRHQIMKDVEHATRLSPNDLPKLPSDMSSLPALDPSNIRAGAIVAFKRLTLSEKFEPHISEYQTAKVQELFDGNTTFTFSLARRDRPRIEKLYNEETGKRVYEKLQAPDDDESIDEEKVQSDLEEFEEIEFADLVEPKLVRTFDQHSKDEEEDLSKSPNATIIRKSKMDSTEPHNHPIADSGRNSYRENLENDAASTNGRHDQALGGSKKMDKPNLDHIHSMTQMEEVPIIEYSANILTSQVSPPFEDPQSPIPAGLMDIFNPSVSSEKAPDDNFKNSNASSIAHPVTEPSNPVSIKDDIFRSSSPSGPAQAGGPPSSHDLPKDDPVKSDDIVTGAGWIARSLRRRKAKA